MSKTQIATGGIADDAISEEHIDATVITGTTELAAQPAATDEIVLSDAGTLKRLDIKHIQNTPAFFVSLSSSQAIANNTNTKVAFDAELFDSDGTFASNKFTPGVAGKYYIGTKLRNDTSTDGTATQISIFKNGSSFQRARHTLENSEEFFMACVLDLDDDDYVEIYSYQNSGGSTTISGGTLGSEGETAFMFGYRLTGL
jgi:hypothetical protein